MPLDRLAETNRYEHHGARFDRVLSVRPYGTTDLWRVAASLVRRPLVPTREDHGKPSKRDG
jgi:hypothetical protein